MAKSKKKGLSDVKNEAAIQKKKSMNPFEVHVNRQKFQVLGRKLKTDRGLPGVARAKAIKKRKETLLQEYKVFGKSNKFVDRRIGEFNKDMTAEDKIMARFAAERASSHKKKAMFNLADDEPLTHKGRSIMELETFEDPPSDDDDLFDTKLDGKFTEEAHFGGGMLKKSEGRMAVIDQLIADSKKRKAEKAAAKEQTLAATEKLDCEWRDLLPVLASSKYGGEENFKKDDYDKILGSLRFEARGTPSDRLKSEAEVAEQEAKRLRELEEDRLRRMNGEMSSKADKKPKHRSADDLDDGFDLDDDDQPFVVAYDDDGKLIDKPDDVLKKKAENSGGSDDDSEDGGSENEDGSDDDEDDESEDDFADLKLDIEEEDEDDNPEEEENVEHDNDSGDKEAEEDEAVLKKAKALKRKRNSESETNEAGDPASPSNEKKIKKEVKNKDVGSSSQVKESTDKVEEGESDTPESPSKSKKKTKKEVKEEGMQEGNDVDEKSKKEEAPSKKKVSFKTGVDMVSYSTEEEPKSVEQLEQMRKDSEKQVAAGRENEKLMETARSELPYTFIVPNEFEEFEELMKDRTLIQQAVIVERMIKCTHPSLKEGNRQKLETLFTFILQRLNDAEYSDTWSSLETFAPYLFDLTQFSPSHAAEALVEVLSEKFSDYMKKKSHYPYPDTLVFLKLVPLLFPTSDKKHQVTTPAFTFISSLLHTCRPNTRRGIAVGLFLCALLTQYLNLSKRIVPEAITYLNGVIGMATLQVSKDRSKFVPPFLPEYKFLCLDSDLSAFEGSCKMSMSDVGTKGTPVDNEFRVRAMFSALTTLETFISFYSDKPGAFLLFEPLLHTLEPFKATVTQMVVNMEDGGIAPSVSVVSKKLFKDRYPPLVVRKMADVVGALENLKKQPLPPLVKKAAPPFLLRLKEPNIRPVFDKSRDKDEKTRLKRRIKKEAKGVLREIRKDRSFLAGVKYKERKAGDQERMRKVKEIYGWGAQQQGELNKLDRIKKRKKFKR